MDGDQTPLGLAATACTAMEKLQALISARSGDSPEHPLSPGDFCHVVRDLAATAAHLEAVSGTIPEHLYYLGEGSTHLVSDVDGTGVDALMATAERSLRAAVAAARELEERLQEAWLTVLHLQAVANE